MQHLLLIVKPQGLQLTRIGKGRLRHVVQVQPAHAGCRLTPAGLVLWVLRGAMALPMGSFLRQWVVCKLAHGVLQVLALGSLFKAWIAGLALGCLVPGLRA